MNAQVKYGAAFILSIICYALFLPVTLILMHFGFDMVIAGALAMVGVLWFMGGFKKDR